MQLAWFQLLVSPVKLFPPAEFQLFKVHFPDPSEVRGQLDPFLSCFESQALYAVAHKTHDMSKSELACYCPICGGLQFYVEMRMRV